MSDSWQIHTLSLGMLELHCLPGIGGRLWDVQYDGQSLLFQNSDLVGATVDLDALLDLPTRSPQFGFPLWGGEKTWIAPDSYWSNGAPFPVLDSGPYETSEVGPDRLRLQSPACPTSNLQLEREISLNSGSSFSIHHRVTNLGSSDRYTGNWSVLMLNRPSKIGLESNPQADIIPVFGDATGMARQAGDFHLFDCEKPQEFKSGTHNPTGRVFIRLDSPNGAVILKCTTPRPAEGDSFAHGHDFEVFNSANYDYCEAEWHSPARSLKPNESLTYHQDFVVRPEADILSDPNTTLIDLELLSCMS